MKLNSEQPINNRIQLLDLTRGLAIGLMFIFHLCFGLAEIGLLDISFSRDYFWISFRAIIVFLFLTLVGIGLLLSSEKIVNKNKSFLKSLLSKRLALLFTYMMLITLFSYYVRPQYYVYFGILHLIFVSSLLGRLLIDLSIIHLSLIGMFFLIVGLSVESNQLNQPLVYWIGLGDASAKSDDFAPLFPWFGLVVFGLILGKLLATPNRIQQNITQWHPQNLFVKIICWAGKYSIHLYFIHFQFFYLLVWFVEHR